MTTLKDLSRHLGLSVTQVSRAINDHDDVSASTKERVREAAKELGYSVNLTARSLVTGRTGMVCLIRDGHLNLPEHTSGFEVISGLSMEFSQRGYQFNLQMTPEGTDPVKVYKKAVASGSFDGFILTDATVNDERVALLEELGVPFVVHGRVGEDPKHAYFDIDNYGVALHQVRHLTKLGHKRIGLLNGRDGYVYSESRIDGYKDGLAEAGIAFDERLIRSGPMIEDQALISTIAMFQDIDPAPTALICSNILLAKGAYHALSALNLSIPQDVSVIAHDDVLSSIRASAFYPALTVTKSPFEDGYSVIADILCSRIDPSQKDVESVEVPFKFIERASTDKPA